MKEVKDRKKEKIPPAKFDRSHASRIIIMTNIELFLDIARK
jgi:hypothetical protein